MSARYFTFHLPCRLHFGDGLFEKLACLSLPGQRALVITEGEAVHTFGLLNLIQSTLREQNINCIAYEKIGKFVSDRQVEAAAALARAENCDFILALGGGGCINAAKAISALSAHSGAVSDYASSNAHRTLGATLPLVCLPTLDDGQMMLPHTFILIDHEMHYLHSPQLFPKICIVDPATSLTLPPHSTAYHGLLSLDIVIGAMLEKSSNLPAVAWAATAWRQLTDILPACCANGQDENARRAASGASAMAAMAGATCACPPEIAIAWALGAAANLPVGVILAPLLPPWHQAAEAASPHRYKRMASALGNRMPVAESFRRMMRNCGIDSVTPLAYPFRDDELQRLFNNLHAAAPSLFEEGNCPLTKEAIQRILNETFLP